ncbi:MAG: MurR/RpiR family transcriptional regulator [Eubacterium sp.]|nr:MurR/RpiR family transcriptional regulator [Eubacterium sp.]
MNLEELVNDKYDLLTANDREILTTVFRDKQSVKEMNSIQLASFLHVSRTTIVRLMKKLGIDSYQEFKLLLNRKEEEHTVYAYDLQDIVKEYHMMVDELKKHDYEKICGIIYEADTIYLYGTGNEQKTIAEEFKRIFLSLGKFCVDLFDLGEVRLARERFGDNDLFLAISLSGENQDVVDVVRAVQETGIRTMSLTRWANNTLARLVQESLYVGTKTVSHTSGQSYEMVAAFYILLDILSVRYLEFTEKYAEEAENESG